MLKKYIKIKIINLFSKIGTIFTLLSNNIEIFGIKETSRKVIYKICRRKQYQNEDVIIQKAYSRFLRCTLLDTDSIIQNKKQWCTSFNPDVSIIIVNWNASNLTCACVNHILSNTEGYTYEIIIIDNGSSENDIAKLQNLGECVNIILLKCNRFFGEANNIGAEKARGKYICMINNDAFVQPGWLQALMIPFERDTSTGATGPLFLYHNDIIQEAGALIDAQALPIRLKRGEKYIPGTIEEYCVDYISAATLIVPKILFFEIGGFDLAYEPAYYEDTDLCLKIKSRGYKIVFCPMSLVYHVEGASTPNTPQDIEHLHSIGNINHEKFFNRWHEYLENKNIQETITPIQNIKTIIKENDYSFNSETTNQRHAVIYTPYPLTPGGGERYILTIAEELSKKYTVSLCTPHPYSILRIRQLENEFELELSKISLITEDILKNNIEPDILFVLGNNIIPPINAYGKKNIFICQFPFKNPEEVTYTDKVILNEYDYIIVYSQYTSSHVYTQLNALQLPNIDIKILNPPVMMVHGNTEQKKRIILSVGRFFLSGHCKRHDLLIQEFINIYDKFSEPSELHLAGSLVPGKEHLDYVFSLKKLAQGYPVYFHINCTQKNLQALYRNAFAYWHGTGLEANLIEYPEKAEHFGISIVEAMSAGAIPLAFNAGGPREIIIPNKTGFLYNSAEELGSITLDLFSEKKQDTIEIFRQNCINRANMYSFDKFRQRLNAII